VELPSKQGLPKKPEKGFNAGWSKSSGKDEGARTKLPGDWADRGSFSLPGRVAAPGEASREQWQRWLGGPGPLQFI